MPRLRYAYIAVISFIALTHIVSAAHLEGRLDQVPPPPPAHNWNLGGNVGHGWSESDRQILLVADTVPKFKIESCRAAEQGSEGRDAQGCFRDEQSAKDKLRETWSSFDASQKTHCQALLKAGGMPSYVELLTCMEMKGVPTTATESTPSRKKKKSP
jgi:hypothetical protein